ANAFMNHEALRLLELAQRIGTADPQMLHDLGVLYGRLGRTNESFASHRQAVALEPKNFVFLRDYGAALLSTGQFSNAAQQLERAVRENPTDGESRFLTGNAWAGQDSVTRAINHWETALEVGYDTGPLRYNLGIALESIGDVYAAEEHLGFAVAREPDSLDYRQRLAVFYLRTNIPEQALKHFREVLARDSANLNARIGIGAAHALAGHIDSAYAELGYVRSVDSARAAVMSRMIEQNLQLRRTIDSAEAAAAEAKALERK
ncbi:MAG TPA: tetratricopeptide repeat protein, partial [candidate division Zixibacteria bacterium]|nr:tetratricopeptide repeat protein [candidate division Zixibacteria bacterium]